MALLRRLVLLFCAVGVVELIGYISPILGSTLFTSSPSPVSTVLIKKSSNNNTIGVKSSSASSVDRARQQQLTCFETNPKIIGPHPYNVTSSKPRKILLVGLPKAGTTSLGKFFNDAKVRTCDYSCPRKLGNNQTLVGNCIRNAVRRGKPPIASCGDVQMYAQMDIVGRGKKKKQKNKKRNKKCYFPQIQALEEFSREHPDAVFLLNMRNVEHWIHSVQQWFGLAKRLASCEAGPESPLPEHLKAWYCQQMLRVRQFVADHPSHTLMEIDIEDNTTGQRLQDMFGLSASYWVQHNRNKRKNNKEPEITSPEEDLEDTNTASEDDDSDDDDADDDAADL